MRTLAALLLLLPVAYAQSEAARDCAVIGTVIDSVSGAPIPRAEVGLVAKGAKIVVDSDAKGNWTAQPIACGDVSIEAARSGYLKSKPELHKAELHPVAISTGSDKGHLKLQLIPQSVIVGRILDDRGDPLFASVTLMTSRVRDGLRILDLTKTISTNDLGEYRIPELPSGRYAICVTVDPNHALSNGAGKRYGRKCYPNAVGGPPDTISIPAGYESRVDFTLPPASIYRIKGVFSTIRPNEDTQVSAWLSQGSTTGASMPNSGQVNADGTFVIGNLIPGVYAVSAEGFVDSPPLHELSERRIVEVIGSDIDGIRLQLEPWSLVNVPVFVRAESSRKILTVPAFWLSPPGSNEIIPDTPWDGTSARYSFSGVVPGVHRIVFNNAYPAEAYVKSVKLGDRDVTGSEFIVGPGSGPLEVLISSDGGTVEGDVTNDDRSAAAWVLLLRDNTQPRFVQTDAKGHFKFEMLPPGTYNAYAWDSDTNVEYANPDWMQRNAKPLAADVRSGQTITLKLIRQIAPQ